jgi:hypothetical protein
LLFTKVISINSPGAAGAAGVAGAAGAAGAGAPGAGSGAAAPQAAKTKEKIKRTDISNFLLMNHTSSHNN